MRARVSLGTLPEAIYDMISREFACDLFRTHFDLWSVIQSDVLRFDVERCEV